MTLMKEEKTNRGLIGMGLLTAIASSLCCITPVLALFAGSSGMASTFSWMEPARPYLIGFTILVLGFAWYQKLKRRKSTAADCNCEGDIKKPSFWQSKKFLGIVTMFAILMTAFPYYSHVFYGSAESKLENVNSSNILKVDYIVEGMTCEACTNHIEYAISELAGYVDAQADFKKGTVYVEFDKTLNSEKEVIHTINETGYKVIQ